MSETTPARRSLQQLLGLAMRAGKIVAGTEMVRQAVRRGEVRLALLAADAAEGQTAKLLPLLNAVGAAYARVGTRSWLGAAVGRSPATALGITDQGFAARAEYWLRALQTEQQTDEEKA